MNFGFKIAGLDRAFGTVRRHLESVVKSATGDRSRSNTRSNTRRSSQQPPETGDDARRSRSHREERADAIPDHTLFKDI